MCFPTGWCIVYLFSHWIGVFIFSSEGQHELQGHHNTEHTTPGREEWHTPHLSTCMHRKNMRPSHDSEFDDSRI